MDNNMTTIWSVVEKLIYYSTALLVLLVLWTEVLYTPYIILAIGHFVAMYLIAKGAK